MMMLLLDQDQIRRKVLANFQALRREREKGSKVGRGKCVETPEAKVRADTRQRREFTKRCTRAQHPQDQDGDARGCVELRHSGRQAAISKSVEDLQTHKSVGARQSFSRRAPTEGATPRTESAAATKGSSWQAR